MTIMALPRPQAEPGPEDAEPMSVRTDDDLLALCYIGTWALRTGRILRDVPLDQLAEEELIGFWADDQITYSEKPGHGDLLLGGA